LASRSPNSTPIGVVQLRRNRSDQGGLEDAAAGRLSAAIAGTTKLPVGRIKARAHKMLGGAVVAYFKARSPEGLALV
jgi:hypothetical protein